MNISLTLLGILTFVSICQGFFLNRSEIPVGNVAVLNSNHEDSIEITSRKHDLDFLAKAKIRETLDFFPSLVEEFVIPIDEDAVKIINSDVPRNIILLFIHESGLDGDKIWNDLKESLNFPVWGFLKSCQKEKNFDKFPLEESMSFEETQCYCEKFLRANVENLLDWANRAKIEISINKDKLKHLLEQYALNVNSTISSSSANDAPNLNQKSYSEASKHNNDWKLIDLNKGKFNPFSEMSSLREADDMWDFFEPFSVIRIAFFQKWLDSLYRNNAKSEPMNANLLELMKDSIDRSKSFSNDERFILIAFSPGNDLSSTIDFLQEKISGRDTLLLVSGTCSQNKKEVPFFAQGPGSKYFYEANSIWDLPLLVKKAASSCDGLWCKIKSLNSKSDLKSKTFKRTARDKGSETEAKNSTETKIFDSNYNSTITTNSTDEKVPVKESQLKNSTQENKSTSDGKIVENKNMTNSINNTNFNDSKKINNKTMVFEDNNNNTVRNATDEKVPSKESVENSMKTENKSASLIEKMTMKTTSNITHLFVVSTVESSSIPEVIPLKKSVENSTAADNKSISLTEKTTMKTTSDNSNLIVGSTVESSLIPEVIPLKEPEAKLPIEKKDQGIEATRFKSVENHENSLKEKSKNETIKENDEKSLKEDDAHSEAPGNSLQTSSAIMSVAMSFASILIFHF